MSGKLSYIKNAAIKKGNKSIGNGELEKLRRDSFKKFTDKCINETDFIIENGNIPGDLAGKYDFFITGSDQVWHPYTDIDKNLVFLRFAPKEKRIAYAPSFGIDKIPPEQIDEYKLFLSEIPHLSVREESGKDIIYDLVNLEPEVLVDPTMLITKKQWLSIAKVPDCKPKSKYLLTCFLGEDQPKARELIRKTANEHQLEIMELGREEAELEYLVDPSEFIDCVSSAELIFTDSFHASVFSILFEKPFVVFEKEQRAKTTVSRIHTLLAKFGLESREFKNIDTDKIFEIDFSHIKDILDCERKKA